MFNDGVGCGNTSAHGIWPWTGWIAMQYIVKGILLELNIYYENQDNCKGIL